MKNTMIANLINDFSTISLETLGTSSLLSRYTTKYILKSSDLNNILGKAYAMYNVLEVNGESCLPYSSTYFDTEDNSMYLDHHNGKLDRYKIRYRTYLANGKSFLEIKRKYNNGKCEKRRIAVSDTDQFSKVEQSFINQNSPYCTSKLDSKLQVDYQRMTLVSQNKEERCTIDWNLAFSNDAFTYKVDDFVVIEVKKKEAKQSSYLEQILQHEGFTPMGMSKYCIGRILTDRDLKYNLFKGKILQINKSTGLQLNLAA